jgi:hypothetical protein
LAVPQEMEFSFGKVASDTLHIWCRQRPNGEASNWKHLKVFSHIGPRFKLLALL